MAAKAPDSLLTLNRLLVVLHRSLPMYLADATPWVGPADEPARQALANLVSDYRISTERISKYLSRRRYTVNFGEFPMEFTDLHDLSLDYLVSQVVQYLRNDLRTVEKLVGELRGDPEARVLGEEVQGNVRGHLELLEKVVADTTGPQLAAS
ncbi:MAG: hypothetical protein SGJ20_16290 [Planctomycetota bacterium]|nr:hypothetical protein [Planctomycetota bacterium]